jgi:hypothetical protein
MMDYIVICFWIVEFNIGIILDLVVMLCKLIFVITSSEICTHRPSLSFTVNEISRSKVAAPEGAAGWSINQIMSISCTGGCTVESIINCTLHLFKDQPEDGPTIGPKHVAAIII